MFRNFFSLIWVTLSSSSRYLFQVQAVSGLVNGIEYGGRVFQPYWDTNQLPVNDTWHPKLNNVVYNGMDWLCPGWSTKKLLHHQSHPSCLENSTLN